MKSSHLFFCFFFSAFSILKADDGFIIKNYDVEVILLESGEIKVEENIKVDFIEKRRGIFRLIPLIYSTNNKSNHKIKIDEIHVNKWNFKISNRGRNKEIRIGHPDKYLSGFQEYQISYKVNGAIAQYEESDEFYWNVIGTEWDVKIENSSFEVRFPYAWKDKIQNIVTLVGYEKSNYQLTVDTLKQNVISSTQNIPLGPHMGLTVAFEIPKGLLPDKVVVPASNNDSSYQEDTSYDWMSIIPAGLLALLFGHWRQNGKREKDPNTVEDQYYPPEGMSPAQVGTFYDYKVNRRDIISLLPFWGDQGWIKMKHLNDDMYFEKIKDIPLTEPEYAQRLFHELFKNGDSTLLSSFKNTMYRTMASTATWIMREVKDRELYDKKALKLYHSGWMIAVFILCIAIGIGAIILLQSIFIGIGFILLGLFCFIIQFFQPKLSEKGYEMHNYLRGLYQFLKSPDPQKIDELVTENPNYIHQLFPYALAFGLDKEWESIFENRDYYAPDWYIYDSLHQGQRTNFSHYAKDFGAHKIEKVFYSAPTSSNSSGGGSFRGGGSVGGGFGGGGGGSW